MIYTGRRRTVILSVVVAIVAALIVFSVFSPKTESAYAANAPLGLAFNVAATYDDGSGNNVPYASGTSIGADRVDFTLTFTDGAANVKPLYTKIFYALTETLSEPISTTGWIEIPTVLTAVPSTDYFSVDYTLLSDASVYSKYVHFRASLTTMVTTESGLVQRTEVYEHPMVYHVMLDRVETTNIRIENIVSQYKQSGGDYADYNANSSTPPWVSTEVRFIVYTTLNPQGALTFNTNEKFFFSTDGGATWKPAYNNICTLQENIDSAITFKVTNLNGTHETLYQGAVLRVRMDINSPEFEITATDAKGGSYVSKSWSSGTVLYTLTPTKTCSSVATYYYRMGTADWSVINSTNGKYTVSFSSSVPSIFFKGESGAGKMYVDKSTYSVNIDAVTPNISINAVDEKATLILSNVLDISHSSGSNNEILNGIVKGSAEGFVPITLPYGASFDISQWSSRGRVGYAQDSLSFSIYNATSSNELIKNSSPLTCYYSYIQYTVSVDSNGIKTYTEESRSNESVMASRKSGEVIFYVSSDAVALNNNQHIVNRVYKFRLVSRSGLSCEAYYSADILYSDFEISLETVSYPTKNARGWAYSAIPVYVNAPKGEYKFYYTISGSTYPEGYRRYVTGVDVLTLSSGEPPYVGTIEEGMGKYRIFLEDAAENLIFTVTALNMADAPCRMAQATRSVKLDMTDPGATLTAELYDDSDQERVVIQDGEWANGVVVLTIDTREYDIAGNLVCRNISGVSCYLSVSGGITQAIPSLTDPITGLETGVFRYTAEIPSGSSVYSKKQVFTLISGAGLEKNVSFTFNIDSTDIFLTTAKITKKSNLSAVETLFSGSTEFSATSSAYSGDVLIGFNSNHDGHFNYYYDIYEFNADVTHEPSFTLAEEDSLSVELSKLNSKGTKVISFYLESTAPSVTRDALGEPIKKKSQTYTIYLPYDNFDISMSIDVVYEDATPDANGWRNDSITIDIALTRIADNSTEDQYTYEIIYLGDTDIVEGDTEAKNRAIENNEWVSLDVTKNPSGSGFYATINGIMVDGKLKAYNGDIAIRALNEAGYGSPAVWKYDIKIDNTSPDILEIVNLPVDAYGKEIGTIGGLSALNMRRIWSRDDIVLSLPEDCDGTGNRAEIKYYYAEGRTTDSTLSNFDSNNPAWQLLTNDIYIQRPTEGSQTEITYWLYAENSQGATYLSSSATMATTFIVDISEISFNVSFSTTAGATDSNTNLFTYSWADSNTVDLSVTSETDVLYWYSVDGLPQDDPNKIWIQYIDSAMTNLGGRMVFEEDMNVIMDYKVSNMAGSFVIHPDRAVIRIDKREPIFTIVATSNGKAYDGGSNTDLNDASGDWSSVAVLLQMSIKDEERNFSPVSYTYGVKYIDESGNEQKLGSYDDENVQNRVATPSNVAFSTDRLDSFARSSTSGKNNDAIITVYATCQGNGKTYQQSIRVKVDKTIPVFTLRGTITDSTNTTNIASGQWTKSSPVKITYSPSVSNVSSVEYRYYVNEASNNTIPLPISGVDIYEACTVVVYATTQSGLTYTYTVPDYYDSNITLTGFVVNIDSQPPVVNTGNISASETNIPNTYYIDTPIYYTEANLKTAQYMTIPTASEGFPLANGHIIATNSVDNSERSKGYVRLWIEDMAGNSFTLEFYMVPFQLDINNLTLTQEDLDMVDRYEEDLANAEGIDDSRRAYFESLITRLRDRETTLRQEIAGFQAYLANLSQKTSYELKSDYGQMYDYLLVYENYGLYDQQWIQQSIIDGEYYNFFLKLQKEFEVLSKQMAQVTGNEDQVRKLPAVNVAIADDYNDVLKVYDAYTDLSFDQKASYNTNLYNKLVSLKKTCETLLLADEESGISIEGELSPGAKITVTQYSNTVELFNNAQATLLETTDEIDPRTIVSIHKVSLSGASSQTETGDILIDLPIPTDYYDYIRFSVYYLSVDGTMTEIEGVEIMGDGKSVQFYSDSLGTFVLVTKANISIRETNDDIYGTLAGIEIDTTMLTYIAIAVTVIFVIVIVITVITGLRRRRFLNHYNKSQRKSIYRRGITAIPKGNVPPRENPYKQGERVKTNKYSK